MSGTLPPMRWRRRYAAVAGGLALVLSACSGGPELTAATTPAGSDDAAGGPAPSAAVAPPSSPESTITISTAPPPPPPSTASTSTTTISPFAPPAWLGTRLLELRPDGLGEVLPTPPELINRAFAPPTLLDPPAGSSFVATVGPVPPDVAGRSSWHPECPVALDDLAYVTMPHHGFDGNIHMGEMIVNARVADDVVAVFERIFESGFPIEEMRVATAAEIEAPPTGDGNVTGSFECRHAVNTGKWSQHAFGLAIDINPFHNPYVKGDLVIPELASYYTDRSLALPGMVETSTVVEAFAEIGWAWGGNWRSLKDWMHFSESGT